jgi:DNA-binding PadR family transcriptional regulator
MPKKESEQTPEPGSLLPLTPAVFHIMLALAQQESHGYGIMLEVDRLTQGQMRLGPGTLYRSIQRMVVDGLIEERKEALESDDDEAARLEQLVKAARQRELLP